MSRQGYRTAQWEGQPPPIEQRPWWNVRHPTAEKSPHGHDKDTPFLWMISSNHVAPGFDHPSMQQYSPWCLLLRFMLMDLPHQIVHDTSLRSWADHLVPQNKAALHRPSNVAPYGKQQQRWGRRFLFSPPASGQSHESDGKWLVVAYLWGESKEWLETVDIGELVASSHCICQKFHERLLDSHSGTKQCQDWYKMSEHRRISAGHSITLVDLLRTKPKSYAEKRERVGTEPRIFSDQLRAYINAFCDIMDSGGRQKPNPTAQKLSEREAEVRSEALCQGIIPPEREVVRHVEAVDLDQTRSERRNEGDVPSFTFAIQITPRY